MKYKYVTSIIWLIVIFSLGSLSFIKADNIYSEVEGRKLQKVPKKEDEYSEKVGNGQLQSEWDKYFNDQMIGRSYMVDMYTKFQKDLGKKEINDVYLCENEYLITKSTIKKIEKTKLLGKAKYYEKLEKKMDGKKLYLVNVPHKIMVYEEKIPIEGYNEVGNEYMDYLFANINSSQKIDLRNALKKDEENYYKTDHHLNMNGIYKSYQYIINTLKKDFKVLESPIEKEEFNIKTYEKTFLGSDGRKVSSIIENFEDIEIYNHKIIEGYKTNIEEIYRVDKIDKKKLNNDYTVYLGGDNPKVEIENKKVKNDLKIAIIGDSIDNPMIPLIGMHFNKTYSYDLRHYKKDVIEEINKNNVDVVLLIGLSNNFIVGDEGAVFKFDVEKE